MTPRLRSASVNDASFTNAPRSLNEFVTCRFSYLTKISAPVAAVRFGAGSIGVRSTCPSITRRATLISSSVTVTGLSQPGATRTRPVTLQSNQACVDCHLSTFCDLSLPVTETRWDRPHGEDLAFASPARRPSCSRGGHHDRRRPLSGRPRDRVEATRL